MAWCKWRWFTPASSSRPHWRSILGWRGYAREHVGFTFLLYKAKSALRLAKYGSVLSLWTVAMLLISGLDTVIVGHYNYQNTGFYAIASSATNVMLAVVSSIFGPMLPALSSMQAGTTPTRMGEVCIKTTRYCTLLLCLLGLPLFFGAYPLLSIWVGRPYAARSAVYLQVLVIGNCIRQLAYPYVIGVVATGKQHLATISAIAEALVNIGLSIWLVQKFGAIGVAIGTLVGAVVSLSGAPGSEHALHPVDHSYPTPALRSGGLITSAPMRDSIATALSFLETRGYSSSESGSSNRRLRTYRRDSVDDWVERRRARPVQEDSQPAVILAGRANLVCDFF